MRRAVLLVAGVLALLLAATLAATLTTVRQNDSRERELLDQRAVEAVAAIASRLGEYEEKLYGLRGSAVGAGGTTLASFQRNAVSQRVERRLPGIAGLGMATAVRNRERGAYVRSVRRQLATSHLPYPPFAIKPPGRRPLYVVNDRIAPILPNTAGFGFDFLTEPLRRAGIARAVREAGIAASAPIRLVGDTGPEKGVALYLPVYRSADQSPPPSQRAALWRGVMWAGVRIRTLLAHVLPRRNAFDLEVYDLGSGPGAARTPLRRAVQTFNLTGAPSDAVTGTRENGRVLPLFVGGRRWAIYYAPTADLLGGGTRALPWIIGGLGALTSLLAAAVLFSLLTARRRAEWAAQLMTTDLRASRNELARRNDELEQFAFLASHDLQQPLRTVSGFLQLLEHQRGDQLDERAREYVGHALAGTRDMGRLIDDLLAYSRAGRDEEPLEPVDLDAAWDAAVVQLHGAIEETGADVSRGSLTVVAGNPGQMAQVFANLIGNAVKYGGEGPPRVRADAHREPEGWRVVAADEGMGIDPADHQRVFQLFRRGDQPGEIEGTGVGLAIVKKVVERSGGTVAIDSSRGAGARFVLRLPALAAGTRA